MSLVRGMEDIDWIRLVQDEDQWRLLVRRVTNFGFYEYKRGV
jgi:hypothetical protein